MDVTVQVISGAEGEIVTVGGVVFSPTVTEPVEVHPLSESVIVTV